MREELRTPLTPEFSDNDQVCLQKLLSCMATYTGRGGAFVLDQAAGSSLQIAKHSAHDVAATLTVTGRTALVTCAVDEDDSTITTTLAEIKALLEANATLAALWTVEANETLAGIATVEAAKSMTAGTITLAEGTNDHMHIHAKEVATGPFNMLMAFGGAATTDTHTFTADFGGHTVTTDMTLADGVAYRGGYQSVTRKTGTIICFY